LRKIKTFAAVLNRRYGTTISGEESNLINKINTAADRMSQLIKEVLAYSRVTHGSKEYVPTDLDIIFRNVVSDLDLLISEKGAVVQYTEAFPTIEAIPLQMNQLFSNLLTNALKFHEASSKPVIAVSFKTLSAGDLKEFPSRKKELSYIELKIEDNGIGFEPEFADQIFQLFERLHSADEYEGTGLGLALCKKIVENHEGEIYGVSTEGAGAIFYVILPMKQSVASGTNE
jgi:signal transduction histidine kinase